MKISVLGAGTWGKALSILLAENKHEVTIWSAIEKEVIELSEHRTEIKNLSGAILPASVVVTNNLEQALKEAELIVMAVASVYVRVTANRIASMIQKGQVIVNVAKGIEETTLKTLCEVIQEEIPQAEVAVLSGPSHAEEVAMGKLTGLIAASENPKNSIRVRDLLRVPGLMVYSSFDVVGVQICAAAKNVIAVVYGAFDAVAEHSQIFGDNSQSLLFAAGLNEIQALGMAMGATHPETFTSIGIGPSDTSVKSRGISKSTEPTSETSNFVQVAPLSTEYSLCKIPTESFTLPFN